MAETNANKKRDVLAKRSIKVRITERVVARLADDLVQNKKLVLTSQKENDNSLKESLAIYKYEAI